MNERAAALERAPYFQRLGGRIVATGGSGAASDGRAEVAADFSPSHANTLGAVHGGIAASLVLWSAELAAWSSQQPSELPGRLYGRALSVHVTYLAAARAEMLSASARVVGRGREAIHLGVDVKAGRGRLVATATVVYRIAPFPGPASPAFVSPRLCDTTEHAKPSQFALSPYIRAAGIEVLREDREMAILRLPLGGNEGADGSIDAGAVLGCIDTCAALACKPFLDGPMNKSSTLSMSVTLGDLGRRSEKGDLSRSPEMDAPTLDDVITVGRLRAREGEAFTATVEAAPSTSRRCFADALVLYRFA